MQVARVDTEILAAVRAQSSSGGRARQDLGAAKATIEGLFSKIRDIQRKAEQSELMVQEICRWGRHGARGLAHRVLQLLPLAAADLGLRGPHVLSCRPPSLLFLACPNHTSIRDIKKLDYAKKHLTATITALRRLSMLINAVGAAAAGAFA